MTNFPTKRNSIKPVFVLGISGATWTIIDPMLKKGKLLNFQRLIKAGCCGQMHSIRVIGDKHYRPQTAWPTLATSTNPENHGITRYWHTYSDLRKETIWDIFQHQGHGVGLYGWPVTWPPPKTNGFVIPCHHARDSQTWPPELSAIKKLDQRQKKLEREKHVGQLVKEGLVSAETLAKYGLNLKTMPSLAGLLSRYLMASDAEGQALLLRYAKLEVSIDFFLNLVKRYSPTFVSFTSFLADFVSHRYWRYFEPERFGETDQKAITRYSNAIEEAYEKLDSALGRCISAMPNNTVVAVVSEHGMSAETEPTEVGFYRYVIRGQQLLKLVGIEDRVVPCPVARWVAFRHLDGAEFVSEVTERISQVTVVETSLPLFNVHKYGNEEVIVKFNIDHTVPRYLEGNLEDLTVTYNGKVVPFLEVARRLGRQRSAMHDEEAIFMIAGPGIRKNIRLQEFSLLDFAPTILRASGLDIPSTFQGKTLDIFE